MTGPAVDAGDELRTRPAIGFDGFHLILRLVRWMTLMLVGVLPYYLDKPVLCSAVTTARVNSPSAEDRHRETLLPPPTAFQMDVESPCRRSACGSQGRITRE